MCLDDFYNIINTLKYDYQRTIYYFNRSNKIIHGVWFFGEKSVCNNWHRYATFKNELPDKIIGQWIIVISTYRWKNFGYTNYSYKTVGFYDKTFLKIDYIPFGFWLLKDIEFWRFNSDIFNQYKPVPVLEHRFKSQLTSKDYNWKGDVSISNFDRFLKQIWDYEIEKKDLAFTL